MGNAPKDMDPAVVRYVESFYERDAAAIRYFVGNMRTAQQHIQSLDQYYENLHRYTQQGMTLREAHAATYEYDVPSEDKTHLPRDVRSFSYVQIGEAFKILPDEIRGRIAGEVSDPDMIQKMIATRDSLVHPEDAGFERRKVDNEPFKMLWEDVCYAGKLKELAEEFPEHSNTLRGIHNSLSSLVATSQPEGKNAGKFPEIYFDAALFHCVIAGRAAKDMTPETRAVFSEITGCDLNHLIQVSNALAHGGSHEGGAKGSYAELREALNLAPRQTQDIAYEATPNFDKIFDPTLLAIGSAIGDALNKAADEKGSVGYGPTASRTLPFVDDLGFAEGIYQALDDILGEEDKDVRYEIIQRIGAIRCGEAPYNAAGDKPQAFDDKKLIKTAKDMAVLYAQEDLPGWTHQEQEQRRFRRAHFHLGEMETGSLNRREHSQLETRLEGCSNQALEDVALMAAAADHRAVMGKHFADMAAQPTLAEGNLPAISKPIHRS